MPHNAVSPMMLAIRVSMGVSWVAACPPPVNDVSSLWAVTRFLAFSLMSNHFFLISVIFFLIPELTASATLSHAAFFHLLVIPAFNVPNNISWFVSTPPTSTSISVSVKFLFFALFVMIPVRGKESIGWFHVTSQRCIANALNSDGWQEVESAHRTAV